MMACVYASGMQTLSEHYKALLGLDKSWRVVKVDMELEPPEVKIHLESTGAEAVCSECGDACPLKDHAPERQWRHLDTMQFTTTIVARIPRTKCARCGVRTCNVPWAEPHSRFTLMFEAFAVQVLQAAASVKQAMVLLRLNWESVHRIMDRAVARGLERRTADEIRHVGIDEKSFRRGHDYVSIMTDIDASRVLEVVPGHDEQAADTLWNLLETEQKQSVEAVAMDMWMAFENSATANVPQAKIVHDRFHISKHLNEAVDKVRRQEHKALMKDGDETLKGTKQLWLYNPENISDEQWEQFESLKEMELKTAAAWALRENFRWFWEYRHAGNARKYFALWYNWATESGLQPMIKVANMLKNRLANILTWFRHPISNGAAEGFNSRIQSLKSAARGFRNFGNYRIRILFFCGKLDLKPTIPGH